MAARSTEYRLQPPAGLRILRAIAGLKRVRKGSIIFEGKRIDGLDPAAIVKLGIAMVPEGQRVFPA